MLTIFLFGALVGGTFGGLMMAALAVGGRADRDAEMLRMAREDYQRTAERMTTPDERLADLTYKQVDR